MAGPAVLTAPASKRRRQAAPVGHMGFLQGHSQTRLPSITRDRVETAHSQLLSGSQRPPLPFLQQPSLWALDMLPPPPRGLAGAEACKLGSPDVQADATPWGTSPHGSLRHSCCSPRARSSAWRCPRPSPRGGHVPCVCWLEGFLEGAFLLSTSCPISCGKALRCSRTHGRQNLLV